MACGLKASSSDPLNLDINNTPQLPIYEIPYCAIADVSIDRDT